MIFIVLPAYNEGASIRRVICEIERILHRDGLEHRFIVVDDGSTDRTAEILSEMRSNQALDVLCHRRNKGIREVFRAAFAHVTQVAADEDKAVLLESDDTNDPTIISAMLKRIDQGYDVVIASRFADGGGFVGFPFLRRVGCRTINRVLRLCMAVDGVTDYTIFFRAYSMRFVRRLMAESKGNLFSLDGFVANAELLSKASRLGTRVAEIPLVYRYDQKRSTSRFKMLFTAWQYARLLYRHYRMPFPG